MKKLLTVLVIFVLGFAAIILVLKMNEENANSSLTTILNSSESETTGEIVSETSPLPTPSPEPVTIPEQIDETLPPDILSRLDEILPEFGSLEKMFLIAQLIDIVENGKEIPDFIVKIFQDKGIDLDGASGESYKEQLSDSVAKYKEEILEWLKSQQ